MKYVQLRAAVERAGHVFFDNGYYNLNIVGVRSLDDAANTFDDWMHIAFRTMDDAEHCLSFRITTDPGLKFRVNPCNPLGTGIVVPGQHRGVWSTGLHKGEPALVQVKALAVYRDNDHDGHLDYDPSTVDMCLGGFNCHKSSKTGTSQIVDGWSAGCQVYANCFDHDVLMALAYRSAAIHGDSFSYTLLRERQL